MQKKVIHLSVVEDFEKQFEKAISLQTRAEIAVVDYNALASKIVSDFNAAGSEFLKANARYQEIEELSKKLGVDPSSVLKNKKQTVSIAIKEIDSYIKQLKGNKVSV
jgi:DNA repair ATPase RecN